MGIRLKKSVSKNSTSLSIIADTEVNGKRTTAVVEALGNLKEISEKYGVDDPLKWAQDYVKELREEMKKEQREVLIKYSTSKRIKMNQQRQFNGGYLFLQEIYYDLQIDKICSVIADKYKFKYDLNSILSRLIFGRILFPCSKQATFTISKDFLEKPEFDLHHIYRALEIIAKESDFIQSEIYKNSTKICDRKDGILYYDCTNYYFEIQEAEGCKQYGHSKENKPNPIVSMGLFTDGNGMPLSFCMFPGNCSEQVTLKPLEKKILLDFELSKFVVCTDAGLSSADNRKFNDIAERAFITTQSVKKLKKHLKDWMFEDERWLLPGSEVDHNGNPIYFSIEKISKELEQLQIKENKTQADYEYIKAIKNRVYYKERWINENGLEQRFIVTFSIKYRDYLRSIRQEQIDTAKEALAKGNKIKQSKGSSYKKWIDTRNVTPEGEIAEGQVQVLDNDKIEKEMKYDGYYGVCTNLDDHISKIIKVNKRRWQIEECFRIMKNEFKARPIFLTRDDRIEAHFMTCFISLIVFRLLERRLNEEFTCQEIISTLQSMYFFKAPGNGFIPTYTRTDLTDALHENFEFRTDYEILDEKNIKKVFKSTKTRNSTQKLKEKYKRVN